MDIGSLVKSYNITIEGSPASIKYHYSDDRDLIKFLSDITGYDGSQISNVSIVVSSYDEDALSKSKYLVDITDRAVPFDVKLAPAKVPVIK